MAKQTKGSEQRSGTVQLKEGAGNRQSGQKVGSRSSAQVRDGRLTSRAAQRAAKQQQLKDAKRAGLITRICILAAVIVGIGLVVGLILYNGANSLPSTPVNPDYPNVDGIACQAGEQLAYHIHVHASIYINGSPSQIPQYVGIAPDGSCFYWMHTHDTSGVIHIESPTQKNYTLGNFLDEWSQRFSGLGYPPELSLTSGWQAWVNGKPY